MLVETKSLVAISPFDSPAAISASTSVSRPLKGSGSRPSAFAVAFSFGKADRSFAMYSVETQLAPPLWLASSRRARIDPERNEEYRRFERERCLAMLRRQPGFLGVFFLRQGEDRAASITIWEDRGAVEALASLPS